METDFLNFHDEEHFGSGLYQDELLDDSQSSILDIVSDSYGHGPNGTDFDSGVIWEQDVEREINGDVAVIPMSSSINAFPKLSNSPPTKDIQKIFYEWHDHLSEDELAGNLDMLDFINPPTSSLGELASQIKLPKIDHFESNQKFKQKPKLQHGGKNLQLLKSTIKNEPDDFDDVDSFDIAKYVIGEEVKQEEVEEVDIETVTEPSEMPVLEARDLTSLLEQFEASEAVNPVEVPATAPVPGPGPGPAKVEEPKKLSTELLEKMRASREKKSISVIPAMPSKKPRTARPAVAAKISNEAVQLDHDYCSPATATATLTAVKAKREEDDAKRQIDDTALRIEKRYKSEIIKQKSDILKYQPTVKNANGQLMVSLLKMNRLSTTEPRGKTRGDAYANNTSASASASAETSPSEPPQTKKRKLNLEEYLQRKGGSIVKSNGNSRANSPTSRDDKTADEKYRSHQELMMKMASEILKTPAKSKTPVAKLDEFVPPESKQPQQPDPPKPPKATNYELVTYVSIGTNTEPDAPLPRIIRPILEKAADKINSNSLITNISETLLQKSPNCDVATKGDGKTEDVEHGEDKVVLVLEKNRKLPQRTEAQTQTEEIVEISLKTKPARQYRARRSVSSSSSGSSTSSVKCKSSSRSGRDSRKQSHRTSSSNSVNSSLGTRWSHSASRSRSRSRSPSVYSNSSYDSTSSRSRSPSLSPSRRWHTDRNSRPRHRYSRRRSRSNSGGYRNHRRSRSPYSRSQSRKRREVEQEKLKEVEERRVIYVGKIGDGTTKADLRRRFQSFGPITNVSVHFREHGDNYGFVTFAFKVDAYAAVEHGNDEPHVPKYDISFGGRRAFCKTRYSDLDNIEAEVLNPTIYRKEEDSFDILLREVQAKLRKRKV